MITKIYKYIMALLLAGVLGFGLMACNDAALPVIGREYIDRNYEKISLTMNAGETFTIDLDEYFKDFGRGFVRYELLSSNTRVVEVKKNVLTAVDAGMADIQVTLYSKIKRDDGSFALYAYYMTIAKVLVINEDTMISITTAQELNDINNDLDGNYILKADIDLSDWGEWTPIGSSLPIEQTFRGIFVNPHGFAIKNLTITTSEKNKYAGLFGTIYRKALISGIVLEKLSIDVSDYDGDDIGSPIVGGIVGYIHTAQILDCTVSGTIVGGGRATGGIAGVNAFGEIVNCTFVGTLSVDKEFSNQSFAIGGIVGVNLYPIFNEKVVANIIDCTVNADVWGGEWASAGGIIGFVDFQGSVKNSSFTGSVAGKSAGTMIGLTLLDPHIDTGEYGPIDFE